DHITALVGRSSPSITHQVANMHTGFNVALAIIGLPLVEQISRLVEKLVPEPPADQKQAFGPRYISLTSPPDSLALALGQSRQEILHMSEIVRSMLVDLWYAIKTDDARLARKVAQRDDHVDLLDDQIKRYLTRLASQETDPEEAAEQMRQLRYLAELEMIGDVIDKNLSELALKKIQLGVDFSRDGWTELEDFYQKVTQNMTIAETAFTTRDHVLAQQLLRHKQRLDDYYRELRDRHFARLNRGLAESHETSAIHLDLLTYLKRINGSVTHVAYAIIQSAEPTSETQAE
ncbi:MAG: PhoU domain-containing protein, partial [Phycisphaeraceae bacterium]